MNHYDIAQLTVRGKAAVLNKEKPFDEHSFIYKKTNERLHDITDILQDKQKILCVIGSGDQILNALLSNPEKIDAFDISVFPKYFLELKIAAIKTLTREEYLSFFIDDISHRKDEYYDELYYRICCKLPEEVEKFWDFLFDFNDWSEIYNSLLFSSEPVIRSYALTQNKYLGEEEYYKLREILKNKKINYITSNILDLDIEEEYDLVYLSNIIQYVDVAKYKEKVENLSEKIKGIIVTYLFGGLDKALDYFKESKLRQFGTNGILIHEGKKKTKQKTKIY